MAIRVMCECGATYDLKDEFGGKTGQCPQCGAVIQVPAAPTPSEGADPIFDRDKFLLRQKHLAITSQKYYVHDEDGNPILYVERPHHLLRTLLAVLAAIATTAAVGLFFAVLGALLGVTGEASALEMMFVVLAVLGTVAAGFAVGVLCIKKRHVTLYRDDTKQERLLDILQHRKFHFLTGTYTVRDADEKPLAILRKHYIYNIFRKRWYCHKPDWQLLCTVKEDSLILSLLRRYLRPLSALLRTNFIFTDPQTGDVLGEFNRKFTILDRYVLDMSADPTRKIDRRVAVAVGVMLDTGEKR